MTRMEFELAYYGVAVKYINHYATRTSLIAGEIRTNSYVTYSNRLLNIDVSVLADQQRLTFTSYAHILSTF